MIRLKLHEFSRRLSTGQTITDYALIIAALAVVILVRLQSIGNATILAHSSTRLTHTSRPPAKISAILPSEHRPAPPSRVTLSSG